MSDYGPARPLCPLCPYHYDSAGDEAHQALWGPPAVSLELPLPPATCDVPQSADRLLNCKCAAERESLYKSVPVSLSES